MRLYRIFAAGTLFSLLAAVSPALAQGADTASAQTVITAVTKNNENPPPLRQQDLQVQVGGKSTPVTDLLPCAAIAPVLNWSYLLMDLPAPASVPNWATSSAL